jgi:hypothetical protein
MRQQNGGASKYSQNSQIIHFGIGAAQVIDKLTVKWPSGVMQTLFNISPDQTLTLNEPTVSSIMTPASVVVPPGGDLSYTLALINETNLTMIVDYWANVTLPNGGTHPATGELLTPTRITIPPLSTATKIISHKIPLNILPGNYTYHGYAGRYKSIWNEGNFVFTVQ